jgi:four helix bundle suffix protein
MWRVPVWRSCASTMRTSSDSGACRSGARAIRGGRSWWPGAAPPRKRWRIGWERSGGGMERDGRLNGRRRRNAPSIASIPSIQSTYPEIAANAALVLIGVACALLDRQIAAQAAVFTAEGGFTERLHRVRTTERRIANLNASQIDPCLLSSVTRLRRERRFQPSISGAQSGGRTHTVSLPTDFESVASANSAIRASLSRRP